MKRKGIAQETLKIQQQGFYEYNGSTIDFHEKQKYSEEHSFLLTPSEGIELLQKLRLPEQGKPVAYQVVNQSTVQAVLANSRQGQKTAVLNFASAKNPGGGFLNGAMAQEEALAAASGLYCTLLRHETYYSVNRVCNTMMYTNHAIYSPDVVFFRDSRFALLEKPVTASVLTLPAVNLGQVILKGENQEQAKKVMKDRMRLCLGIFAKQGDRNVILGAYGCGVFRNDPEDVARWWQELLEEEGFGACFDRITFAILDRFGSGNNLKAFEARFL